MQGVAAQDLFVNRSGGDTTMIQFPSQPILTITQDGKIIPGDGLTMDEVATAFLVACSQAHTSLEDRATNLERLLRECRFLIRGLGLRLHAKSFWQELDALLGTDAEDDSTEMMLAQRRE